MSFLDQVQASFLTILFWFRDCLGLQHRTGSRSRFTAVMRAWPRRSGSSTLLQLLSVAMALAWRTLFLATTRSPFEESTYLHPPPYSSTKGTSLKVEVAQWETPLKWLVLWVDHEHLRPRPPTNHPLGMKLAWGKLVKPLNVDLGLANIDNIAGNAGNFLQSLGGEGEKTSIKSKLLLAILKCSSCVNTAEKKRHSKTLSV